MELAGKQKQVSEDYSSWVVYLKLIEDSIPVGLYMYMYCSSRKN